MNLYVIYDITANCDIDVFVAPNDGHARHILIRRLHQLASADFDLYRIAELNDEFDRYLIGEHSRVLVVSGKSLLGDSNDN